MEEVLKHRIKLEFAHQTELSDYHTANNHCQNSGGS